MTTVNYVGPEQYYEIYDWSARIPGSDYASTRWDKTNDWSVDGLDSAQTAYLTGVLRGLFQAGGGGGGGSVEVELTLAELETLRAASGLSTTAVYVVTDFTQGPGMPGPNRVIARAESSDQISPEVLLQTAVQNFDDYVFGAHRGTMVWDPSGPSLEEAWDQNGNHASGYNTVRNFPWGLTGNWYENDFREVSMVYADIVASGAIAEYVHSNSFVRGSLSFVNWNGGQIAGSTLTDVSVNFGGSVTIQDTEMNSTQLSVDAAAVLCSIVGSSLHGGLLSVAADATLEVTACKAIGITGGSTLLVEANSAGNTLKIEGSTLQGARIHDTSFTGSGQTNSVERCNITDSTVEFSGSDIGRRVLQSDASNGSRYTVLADVTTTNPLAIDRSEVARVSSITVSADGTVHFSQVAGGTDLTTGDFDHQAVIVNGFFAPIELTADNNGNYKGFGVDTLV